MGDGETLATTSDGAVGSSVAVEPSELAAGTHVGRFVVLARVGAGGMGEVYSAFDPELDRRVAIKLLRADIAGTSEVAEARLRREARTMARLVDRNLVTVHDVGVHHGRVFVAMEFVDGETFRTWCKDKPWPQILGAYLEAGLGLAAAHAAGIVHRDFKPDNVLVARDGRVAVTDFGIARTPGSLDPDEPAPIDDMRLTSTGAIIGTPRYMAPEQLDGAGADVRSDQFSFCVSLWEALYGEHPFAPDEGGFPALREAVLRGELRPAPASKVPPRVRQALARGLAVDPARRWPTFAALQEALDVLAPSRRWVWAVLAASAVVAGGAIAYGAWQAEHRVVDPEAACTGSPALLHGVWDEARKAEVDRAFVASRASYAPAAQALVHAGLDEWAHRWVDARTHACRATRVYFERSDQTLDAEMRCFDAQRGAARALVDVLAHADADEIGNVGWAMGKLPRPEQCNDPTQLAAQALPSDPARARMVEDIEQRVATARALAIAGDLSSSIVVLGPATVAAPLSGHVESEAQVEAALGEAMVSSGNPSEARPHLEHAERLADEARDDALREDVALELATVAYYGSRYDDADRWLDVADAVGHRLEHDDDRIGDVEDRAVALQLRGEVELEHGDPAGGLAHIQQAVKLFEQRPPAIELATVYGVLAAAEDANQEPNLATIDHKKAIATAEATVGDKHPLTSKLVDNFGAFLLKHDQLDAALPMFQRALAIKEAAFGPDDPSIAYPLENVAVVLRRKGQLDAAEVAYARALALFEKDPDAAYAVPTALNGLALLRMEQHRPADAVPLLERAIGLRKGQADVTDGENQFLLARAMWLAGQDHDAARQHAFVARDMFVQLGATAARHKAEVERWLADPVHFVTKLDSTL